MVAVFLSLVTVLGASDFSLDAYYDCTYTSEYGATQAESRPQRTDHLRSGYGRAESRDGGGCYRCGVGVERVAAVPGAARSQSWGEVVTVSGNCFIYGLRDPRTMEIRYVGLTSTGMKRPEWHSLWHVRDKSTLYVHRWLKKLFVSTGMKPEIVVLERVESRQELNDAEIRWIAIGRAALGKRFTNCTRGGEGAVDLPPEVLRKMSKTHKALAATPEGIARLKKLHAAAKTPAAKAKFSISMKQYAATPDGLAHAAMSLGKARQSQKYKDWMEVGFSDFMKTPKGRAILEKMWIGNAQYMATSDGRAQALAALEKGRQSPQFKAAAKARFESPEGRAELEKMWALARSPEAIAKMSASLKARAATPEGKAHQRRMVELARTPEAIAKSKAATAEIRATPEYRARLGEAIKRSVTSEMRAKNSERGKAYRATPEGRAQFERMAEAQKAPEVRRKMSIAHTGKKDSDETRAKKSVAIKASASTPEGRQRMVELARAGHAAKQEKRLAGKRNVCRLTPEQRQEKARRLAILRESIPIEQRRAWALKASQASQKACRLRRENRELGDMIFKVCFPDFKEEA